MAEHEAHHRGQLYLMASLRGRPVAPLFGLTEEQLAAASEPAEKKKRNTDEHRSRQSRASGGPVLSVFIIQFSVFIGGFLCPVMHGDKR